VRDVIIPAVGMAMTEALLATWLKQPGDVVAAGEAIAEIETDKATMELESPAAGVLGAHLFATGSMVPIAEPVCRILEPGEVEVDASAPDRPAGEAAPVAASVPEVPSYEGIFDELRTAEPEVVPSAVPVPEPPDGAIVGRRTPHTQSPRQRRLARLALQERASAVQPASGRRRDAIAALVAESWRTIPHFAVSRDVDATAVVDALRYVRQVLPAATVTDLLLHAFAVSMTALPGSTSGDVGLAVATDDGVMMPVIADADALTLADLVSARQAAVSRARDGRLADVDVSRTPAGSLSNLGAYGVDSFTGIIPLGQQCLITIGRIAPRMVAEDRTFSIRDTMNATLNIDHRRIDGDGAARALDVFARALGSLDSWLRSEA
jgi:pyruvate dehydrogenase E2 component (dihydrolipoamide acetyltransferase)